MAVALAGSEKSEGNVAPMRARRSAAGYTLPLLCDPSIRWWPPTVLPSSAPIATCDGENGKDSEAGEINVSGELAASLQLPLPLLPPPPAALAFGGSREAGGSDGVSCDCGGCDDTPYRETKGGGVLVQGGAHPTPVAGEAVNSVAGLWRPLRGASELGPILFPLKTDGGVGVRSA